MRRTPRVPVVLSVLFVGNPIIASWSLAAALIAAAEPQLLLAQSTSQDSAERTSQTTCIAIMLPGVQGADSAQVVAASLRDLFVSFLTGPSLRALALDARLSSQAIEEARQNVCGHMLTTTLTHKRGGGGVGRVLSEAATGTSRHIPFGTTAASNAVRSAAIGGAYAVSAIASNTRARDEMRVEFRVSSTEGAQLQQSTEIRKAKTDGEDLVTPLVERVAAMVANTIGR